MRASGKPERRLLHYTAACYFREGVMSIQLVSRFFGLLAAIILSTSNVASAQTAVTPIGRVPVHGVTGTLALPSSVDKFYSDLNKIVVSTSDGISHVTHGSPGPKVRSGTSSLDSLRPGTPVVVHYAVKGIPASSDAIDRVGPDGLNVNEGHVTSVDNARKRITVKLSNGTTQTLRLTQHAADDPHTLAASRVFVYYSDESGQRRAQSFKPVH
jgi:hypothetical protein